MFSSETGQQRIRAKRRGKDYLVVVVDPIWGWRRRRHRRVSRSEANTTIAASTRLFAFLLFIYGTRWSYWMTARLMVFFH